MAEFQELAAGEVSIEDPNSLTARAPEAVISSWPPKASHCTIRPMESGASGNQVFDRSYWRAT